MIAFECSCDDPRYVPVTMEAEDDRTAALLYRERTGRLPDKIRPVPGGSASPASDLPRELRKLGEDIHQTKIAKGWTVTTPEHWKYENQIPADLALIHSEVSEALEAFRKDDRDGFLMELADVLIRVVGLAHGLNVDLGEAVLAKAAANRERAFRHGGKRL